ALAGRDLESGQIIWIPDCAQEFDLVEESLVGQAGLREALGIPIMCGSEVIGVLEFFRLPNREPDEQQLEMLRTIGSQIGQFMKRKQAEEAVYASEARKTAILEAALDAIITIDQE